MWRLSTGLRNALLEYDASCPNIVSDTSISFGSGDGTNGRDTINDSSSGLGDFKKNDKITVKGSTSNDGTYRVLSATAAKLEVASGSLTNESEGAKINIASAVGGSYAGILRNGIIRIYSGSQPASSNDAETGTLLCEITLNSGTFTPGSPDNGINIGQVSNAIAKKAIDPDTGNPEVWSGIGLADGTAGWFRWYSNDVTTGSSSEAKRLDGAIGTSGAQLNMSNTSITTGATVTIDSVNLPLPENP